MPDNIRVVCRFRPVNSRERKEQEESGIGAAQVVFFPSTQQVEILASALGKQTFNFDRVFPPDTAQPLMFKEAAQPVILDIVKGFNGTIFAYGQTGAGKSWSMFGDVRNPENNGIIPRSSRYIFEYIADDDSGSEFQIKCSFLEIYNETINDLLNPAGKNLKIKESRDQGIFVESLTAVPVGNLDEIMECLDIGEASRSVSFTQMNAVSSRSHSVFIVVMEQKNPDGAVKKAKLNLVDLAGSEKIGKTGAEGQTLAEAKKINQSLSSLGNCINALVEGSKHVPFRDSKLTRILQDALGGNCKTTLMIACSPHEFNVEETLSTLKFGARAKTIKLKAKVNAQRSPAEMMRMIDNLTKQVSELRGKNTLLEKAIAWFKSSEYAPGKQCPFELEAGEGGDEKKDDEESNGPPTYDPEAEAVLQVKEDKIREQYVGKIQELEDEILELKKADESNVEEIQVLHQQLNELNAAHNDVLNQLADLQSRAPEVMIQYVDTPQGTTPSTPETQERIQPVSEVTNSTPVQVVSNATGTSTPVKTTPQVVSSPIQSAAPTTVASPVRPVASSTPVMTSPNRPGLTPLHAAPQQGLANPEAMARITVLERQIRTLEYDNTQLQHQLEVTQRNFQQRLADQVADLTSKFTNQKLKKSSVVKPLCGRPRTLHEASKENIDLFEARRRLRKVSESPKPNLL
ncbi:hypothetical protein RCL1_001250 [Eukaryota sp. TZLM3-RCL]